MKTSIQASNNTTNEEINQVTTYCELLEIDIKDIAKLFCEIIKKDEELD
ncbi:MAG: hypothetical protein FWG20_05770 [Candidatus Cloacimonetes bacterium]|nr:hypothetical protein [Candidatus Cloacimonadota bacterium]